MRLASATRSFLSRIDEGSRVSGVMPTSAKSGRTSGTRGKPPFSLTSKASFLRNVLATANSPSSTSSCSFVMDPPVHEAALEFAFRLPVTGPRPENDWSMGATTNERIAIKTAAAIQSRWFLRKYEKGLAIKKFPWALLSDRHPGGESRGGNRGF